MSPENAPDPAPGPAAASGRAGRVLGERAIEALIRLSGVSAILFVVAIFFFVLREAAPVLFREDFSLGQFLFSTEWYPTSANNVRYGTLALTVGTLSVTALAMAPRRALRPRGRDLPLRVLRAPGARDAQDRDRAALRDPERRVGLRRPHRDEQADRAADRGAGGRQHPERRDHPRPDERAGHRLDRRGRAEGGARLLPRGRPRPRRHPLAARLPGARCPPRATGCWPRCCSGWAGRWGRRWPC